MPSFRPANERKKGDWCQKNSRLELPRCQDPSEMPGKGRYRMVMFDLLFLLHSNHSLVKFRLGLMWWKHKLSFFVRSRFVNRRYFLRWKKNGNSLWGTTQRFHTPTALRFRSAEELFLVREWKCCCCKQSFPNLLRSESGGRTVGYYQAAVFFQLQRSHFLLSRLASWNENENKRLLLSSLIWNFGKSKLEVKALPIETKQALAFRSKISKCRMSGSKFSLQILSSFLCADKSGWG